MNCNSEGIIIFIPLAAIFSPLSSVIPAISINIEGQADFVFTGRGFHAISLLLAKTQRRHHFVALLFGIALTYNICAIGVCLAGHMNPLLAAIIMPLSSIVTTAIAARI